MSLMSLSCHAELRVKKTISLNMHSLDSFCSFSSSGLNPAAFTQTCSPIWWLNEESEISTSRMKPVPVQSLWSSLSPESQTQGLLPGESLSCILVSKMQKLALPPIDIPLPWLFSVFTYIPGIFPRLLIRCLLSSIFSYFTCKARDPNINKLWFFSHSSPSPKAGKDMCPGWKLFWYSYFIGTHHRDIRQKEFVKEIKINVKVSSGRAIINNKRLG